MRHGRAFIPRSLQHWRRALHLALLILAIAAAATCLSGHRTPPAAAQLIPLGNGDVNADRAIDIGDPIYLLTYLFNAGPPPEPIQNPPRTDSVALVVRHTERFSTGDECLTPEGMARAEHLADILLRTKVDGIFSTDFCRTEQTMQPLAQQKGLNVQRLASANLIVAAVKALPPGSTAVVAGNSFNVPDILLGLGCAETVTVPGAEYDNLWVVHYAGPGAGPSTLTHLRY